MKGKLSPEWASLSQPTRSIIEAHQTRAPVPVGAIASDLGLLVKVSTLPVNVSGEIRPDPNSPSGFTIKVDRHESKERQRFTLAHEIAHYLLHPHLIKNGLSDDVLYRSTLSNRREAEANRLAADILMPTKLISDWFDQFKDAKVADHIEPLAQYLGVSKVALEIHLQGRKYT